MWRQLAITAITHRCSPTVGGVAGGQTPSPFNLPGGKPTGIVLICSRKRAVTITSSGKSMNDEAKDRQIPIVLIVVGLILYAIAAFTRSGPAGAASVVVAALVLGLVQTVLLTLAAFIASSIMGISFGELPTAALKFAGVALVVGGLSAILPWAGLIWLVVFLGLVVYLFELQIGYAIGLTIIYWLLGLILAVALRGFLR